MSEEVAKWIPEAGQATGSSRNQQPWRFVLVTDRSRLRELSNLVMLPANVAQCAAAVAVVLTNPRAVFDAGRVTQNMMVAAWSLGVGSCPNSPADGPAIKKMLKIPDEMGLVTIISLGYPARGQPRPRIRGDPGRVLGRINRLPLTELVHRETYKTAQ